MGRLAVTKHRHSRDSANGVDECCTFWCGGCVLEYQQDLLVALQQVLRHVPRVDGTNKVRVLKAEKWWAMATKFNRAWRPCLLGVLTLGLGACAGDYKATVGAYEPTKSDLMGQARLSAETPAIYRLGAGDAIQIKVYGEPDLSFDRLVIDQSGTFNLAIAGDVQAAGLTANELAEHLRAALGRQIINPQVTVNLLEYGSQKITVEGAVAKPGIYTLPPGTTLLGALATAGDPERVARVKAIAIIRTDDKGKLLAVVDLHAVRAGKMIDPVLMANDRVVVGVSAGRTFYQDMLSLIPAAVIFSRF
ncbi:polysaccharide biosynthesis/export family protein [Novosphingobium sp. FSW06-99]|uniref:polysaccharide biosynthesis/export family protein n=1 Tax=Novosphingobium sp. FSW06-99 TaxID=1739113 RepID=UPI0018D23146|nr:polysaccharide biosynthesis/export family protein [Novosphingobium sp. FSW06-99]